MSDTREQTDEKRALHDQLVSMRSILRCVCHWVFDCIVWPFEVVNPVLQALTHKAIGNFDVLSGGYTSELRRHGKT
ncbi:unnamed protein product [Peronospora belbahrii]|uniref:Uncharacterized protein n=1 Tax=Peronospora belbahrii TaxID=622444 RepID=A0AAU9KT80_9STRA|nr:unnamed protein product [Peronospora belbahrii]CAH0514992.1 unnamed protein product [Peronospora belbahrii]